MSDSDRIYELLQSLNDKLADTQARVAGLEVAVRAQMDASNRSYLTTEERLRTLERERAFQKDFETLEVKFNELEKSEQYTSSKFKFTFGILALIGSGVVSAVMSYVMKHLL